MPSLDAASWLIVLWLFALGAAVGSFLNVVVHRLPLGISLVHPPSHCPKCGRPIRWFDNVPIFGWIMLRGRCRQCHNPIAIRYPVVEAFTAALFAVLACFEMRQLPTVYPFHLLLLCTLLCASLIEFDANQPPLLLFVPALVGGALAPLFWPELRPVSLSLWPQLPGMLRATADGLAGLAAGGLLAAFAWGLLPGERLVGLTLSLICVGLYLGFPDMLIPAICATLITAPRWLPQHVSPRLRIPPTVLLSVFTLVFILSTAILATR
jgi:leader peptidase (prepilin peptidase) / N-methyltransferase